MTEIIEAAQAALWAALAVVGMARGIAARMWERALREGDEVWR